MLHCILKLKRGTWEKAYKVCFKKILFGLNRQSFTEFLAHILLHQINTSNTAEYIFVQHQLSHIFFMCPLIF